MPSAIALLGKPAVLPGESERFDRLLDYLAREHGPVTLSEWLIVHELAGLIVTKLRFWRAQTTLFLPPSADRRRIPFPGGPMVMRPGVEEDEDAPRPSPPPAPPPPRINYPPRILAPPPPPTDWELGIALREKIHIFTGSEAIIASLDRRIDLLTKRLKQMKDERTRTAPLIDVTAKTVDRA
jgi:hypothetical protein